MRILLMSAASFAVLSVAPAAAQSYYPGGSGGYGSGYSRGAVPSPWQIRAMVDAAERRGDISEDQASNLRERADDLVRLDRRARRYDDDGDLRREVDRRSFALMRDLRQARSGGSYAYRGGTPAYPAYRAPPQGDDRYAQPTPGYRAAPGDDDDESYPPPSSDDQYRAAPRDDDQPSYGDRGAPAPDDQYDDGGSSDDGSYPPPRN